MNNKDQVWYTVSRTINLGNYESIKFDVGESRSVEDGDDSDAIFKETKKTVNSRLSAILNKLKEEHSD